MGPSVRRVALSQSFPTANAHDPAALDVRVTLGAPERAEPPAMLPVPEAPDSATTVSD